MPELLRGLRTRFCGISPGQQVSSSTTEHCDLFIDAYTFSDFNGCRMRPDTEADRAARAAAASAVSKTAKSRLCPPLSRYIIFYHTMRFIITIALNIQIIIHCIYGSNRQPNDSRLMRTVL